MTAKPHTKQAGYIVPHPSLRHVAVRSEGGSSSQPRREPPGTRRSR